MIVMNSNKTFCEGPCMHTRAQSVNTWIVRAHVYGSYTDKHAQIFQKICVVVYYQGGGKVGQMSLFDWKLEAATGREKQQFIHFQVLLSNQKFTFQV